MVLTQRRLGRIGGDSAFRRNRMEFFGEFWAFLRARKKFWLLPIFVMMVVFGGLLVLTQGSAIAPFIYTVF